MSSLSQFFGGTPAQFDQRSRLGPNQQGIQQNLSNAAQGAGAGGAFGDAADYYRGLLSNNSSDLQAMIAPEQRRFQQQTIPGLAEQFAGLGAGGLSGSGFRNAGIQAGTDLGERIANIRAQLRSQGAAGLAGIGQQSLGDYFNNTYTPRSPGLIEQLAPVLGQLAAVGLAPATGGLSALIPVLMQLLQRGNNGLNDQIDTNQYASGPYSQGATYNPYTGIQS